MLEFEINTCSSLKLSVKQKMKSFLDGLFPAAKGELGEPCDAPDGCLDPGARCIRGICRCEASMYDNKGVCGKLHAFEATLQMQMASAVQST